MASDNPTLTISRRLPSKLTGYQPFIEEVLQELSRLGWSHDLFAVEMALEEAITNGIRHGNKEDPEKYVSVECRMDADRFWAQICDEGPGYDPDAIPDCTAEENLEAPGGRGLMLIRSYMDRVDLSKSGSCTTLEKRRTPPATASDGD